MPVPRAGVPIIGVTVNGQPVAVLDAAGDFFTNVSVPQGSTTLTFVATDALGDTASTTITLTGVTPAVATATDSNLILDANFQGTYYRTSFDEQTKTLYADLTLQNSGQYPLGTPLYLAVKDISDPTVLLRGYAGVLADGTRTTTSALWSVAPSLSRAERPRAQRSNSTTQIRFASLTRSSFSAAPTTAPRSSPFRRSQRASGQTTPIKRP